MLHRQTHHRDVVEVVANLAHHLARPREPVVAIRAQQTGERAQAGRFLADGYMPHEIRVDLIAESRLVAHRNRPAQA